MRLSAHRSIQVEAAESRVLDMIQGLTAASALTSSSRALAPRPNTLQREPLSRPYELETRRRIPARVAGFQASRALRSMRSHWLPCGLCVQSAFRRAPPHHADRCGAARRISLPGVEGEQHVAG